LSDKQLQPFMCLGRVLERQQSFLFQKKNKLRVGGGGVGVAH